MDSWWIVWGSLLRGYTPKMGRKRKSLKHQKYLEYDVDISTRIWLIGKTLKTTNVIDQTIFVIILYYYSFIFASNIYHLCFFWIMSKMTKYINILGILHLWCIDDIISKALIFGIQFIKSHRISWLKGSQFFLTFLHVFNFWNLNNWRSEEIVWFDSINLINLFGY